MIYIGLPTVGKCEKELSEEINRKINKIDESSGNVKERQPEGSIEKSEIFNSMTFTEVIN